MLIGFEHVGMTCGDLDRTIDFYCGLLGLTLALRKKNDRGEMAFLENCLPACRCRALTRRAAA